MKKILASCFILSTISFANTLDNKDNYVEVRVGHDIYSKYESFDFPGFEFLRDDTDSKSFELSFEGMKKYNNFDLGLGISLQNHSKRDISSSGTDGGNYDSIPIYFITKYNFKEINSYVPYLKLNLGYAFNYNGDDLRVRNTSGNITNRDPITVDNGIYFAVGGGLEYNNFTVDLMYGIIKSDIKSKTNALEYAADYEKLTLSLGYKFNI